MKQVLSSMAQLVEESFRERGFERRDVTFVRPFKDVRQAFWLQTQRGSQNGDLKFTANLQVAIDALLPKASRRATGPLKHFHWQARLLDISTRMEDDWLHSGAKEDLDLFCYVVDHDVLPEFEKVDGAWIVARWRSNLGTGLSLPEERRALLLAQEAGY